MGDDSFGEWNLGKAIELFHHRFCVFHQIFIFHKNVSGRKIIIFSSIERYLSSNLSSGRREKIWRLTTKTLNTWVFQLGDESPTSLRSYPKVAPEIKSSTILKHANNWGFCAKNSRLAHHFFVYLFNFFLSFLKVAPEEKKLLGAKAKVAPEKSGKSGPKRKQGIKVYEM